MEDAGSKKAAQAAQAKHSQEFEGALLTPPGKRTPPQNARIANFLTNIGFLDKLSTASLNSLITHTCGLELYMGQTLFRAGDPSDMFYIIAQGQITLYDIKEGDEDSDPVVEKLGAKEWFGEEEILSSSRRAFTAVAGENATMLLRVPVEEYRKSLEDLHIEAFDAKVEFLASLAPLRPLRPEVVRKLAPCFLAAEFHAKEVIVRQGEKADAMYAIRTGSCAVIVDPHYKDPLLAPGGAGGQGAGGGPQGPGGGPEKLGELDPKKTLQVCTLNAGAIIGDITVLASVKRRTASVIATSELLAFRIRRSVFLRRLPADQLEVLRRLATEKLRLTDKKVNSRPAAKGLMDQILHGHNLRELFNQQARLEGTGEDQPESYQQLIHVLRRYKRSAAPHTPGAGPAGPGPGSAGYPTHPGGTGRRASAGPYGKDGPGGPMGHALSAALNIGGGSAGGVSAVAHSPGRASGVLSGGGAAPGSSGAAGSASARLSTLIPPGVPTTLASAGPGPHGHGPFGGGAHGGPHGPHPASAGPATAHSGVGQQGMGPGISAAVANRVAAAIMTGVPSTRHASAAVAGALARSFPPPPGAAFATPQDDPKPGAQWRPISPRRGHPPPASAPAGSQNQGLGQGRPATWDAAFSSADIPAGRAGSTYTSPHNFNYSSRPFVSSAALKTLSAEAADVAASQAQFLPPSMVPLPASLGSKTTGILGLPSPAVLHSAPLPQPPHRPHSGETPGSQGVHYAEHALRPMTASAWSSAALSLPHTPGTMTAAYASEGGGNMAKFMTQLDFHLDSAMDGAGKGKPGVAQELEAALDKLSAPLLDAKAKPALRRGTHYRPTIPKALL